MSQLQKTVERTGGSRYDFVEALMEFGGEESTSVEMGKTLEQYTRQQFDMSQSGKIALVTGGARGIGRTFVESLLEEGASVSIVDLLPDVGKTAEEDLSQIHPGKVIFLHGDVSDKAQFEDCFKKTINRFGRLDIVINNAGVSNEWNRDFKWVVDINFNAVVTGTRLGFEYMKTGGGTIINIGSTTYLASFPALAVYTATKAAVNQFSRSCGTDLFYKQYGVKVVCINPGYTYTPLVEYVSNIFKGYTDIEQSYSETTKDVSFQNVGNMGKGLIEVLNKADNGTIWTIENNEPPKLTIVT